MHLRFSALNFGSIFWIIIVCEIPTTLRQVLAGLARKIVKKVILIEKYENITKIRDETLLNC